MAKLNRAPAEPLSGSSFVAGDWHVQGLEAEDRDPGNGELVGLVRYGDADTVDAAVTAARDAFPGWCALSPVTRGRYLERAAQILERDLEDWAWLITREMGKPIRDARNECARAIRSLRYFAAEGERSLGELFGSELDSQWLFTRREPLGVVAILTPWNFPAAIPAWKTAPALVFGNTVVLKLSEDAPLSGLRLARALHEAGLPPGVLNVVLGDGDHVGRPLTTHPGVNAIAFTGSSAVGHSIMASGSTGARRLQLEMGGHNPAVVCRDANVPAAASAIASGAFAEAGQKCTATRRVYVHDSVATVFLQELLARTKALRVGYGGSGDTDVGPLVNERQLGRVSDAVEEVRDVALIRYGGGQLAEGPLASGFFFEPTIVTDLSHEARLARDEVFGPVLSVWTVRNDEEALELANATPYGLSAAVHTSNLDTAKMYIAKLTAGVVRVNAATTGAEVHVPFGGWGISGHGPSEQGRGAIEFFTKTKTVYFAGMPSA